MRRSAGLVLIALVLAATDARGQGCCTPGTSPLGPISGGSLRRGGLELGLTADGYDLRHARRGREEVEDPAHRTSRVLTSRLHARYGLGSRIAILASMPLDRRERDQTVTIDGVATTYHLENTDLGDLSTWVLARALPRAAISPWSLSIGAGWKWPVGPDEKAKAAAGTGTVKS